MQLHRNPHPIIIHPMSVYFNIKTIRFRNALWRMKNNSIKRVGL